MPQLFEIAKLVVIPFLIPRRLYNFIMGSLNSVSGNAKEEKKETTKFSVMIPWSIVSAVFKESLIEKVQTESGAVLHFNYKILTDDKKPHSMTMSGSEEACHRAKELFEEALMDEELRISMECSKFSNTKELSAIGAGDNSTTTGNGFNSDVSVFNDFVKVEVMRLESPDIFLVKVLHGKWKPLKQMLKDYCQLLESEDSRKALHIKSPQLGEVVALHVKEKEGNMVRRAEVTLIIPDRGLIELTCVDTSDPMLIEESKHLYRLSPELMKFPYQIVECGIADIEPLSETEEGDKRWTETNKYLFDELVSYRENPIYAKAVTFTNTTNSDGHAITKPCVQLWEFDGEQEVNLIEEYIEWGQANHKSSKTK